MPLARHRSVPIWEPKHQSSITTNDTFFTFEIKTNIVSNYKKHMFISITLPTADDRFHLKYNFALKTPCALQSRGYPKRCEPSYCGSEGQFFDKGHAQYENIPVFHLPDDVMILQKTRIVAPRYLVLRSGVEEEWGHFLLTCRYCYPSWTNATDLRVGRLLK